MNWETIGSISELVGAIAVLATLIYLARQIRQNAQSINRQTEIARAQILQSRADSVTQMAMLDSSSPESAELFSRLLNTKGIGPKELTPEENVRAWLILTTVRSNYENTFMQFQQGYLPKNFYEEVAVKNNQKLAQLLFDFDLPLTTSFRKELVRNLAALETNNDA
jgi:hypothetical protein